MSGAMCHSSELSGYPPRMMVESSTASRRRFRLTCCDRTQTVFFNRGWYKFFLDKKMYLSKLPLPFPLPLALFFSFFIFLGGLPPPRKINNEKNSSRGSSIKICFANSFSLTSTCLWMLRALTSTNIRIASLCLNLSDHDNL